MRKLVLMSMLVGIGFYGCASLLVKPVFKPYTNIVPVRPNDLEDKFIDLTGRKDASEIIQKQEYVKKGIITYDVTYNEKELEKIKEYAKQNDIDAIIIISRSYKISNLTGGRYGIEVEAIKYK